MIKKGIKRNKWKWKSTKQKKTLLYNNKKKKIESIIYEEIRSDFIVDFAFIYFFRLFFI